jgi:hypothetical protein
MITASNYLRELVYVNGIPRTMDDTMKIFASLFFLVHYGLFQFGYFLFLLQFNPHPVMKTEPDFSIIIPSAVAFAACHLFSFIYNWKLEKQYPKNINKMMFAPYGRIILMHAMILLGAYLVKYGITIIIFLILKTIADLWSHAFTHRHNDYTNIPNVSY